MLDILRVSSLVVGTVLGGRRLDEALASALQRHGRLTPHQRAAIQDACYGTLRHLGRIDAMLGVLVQKPLTDERLLNLLRVGVYALEYTRAAPHAVVDHAVQACASLGVVSAKGLVNAVLRNLQRRHDAITSTAESSPVGRYSHAAWWIEQLRADHPQRYADILDADNRHPPLTLRVNCRRTTRDAYLALLRESGMAARAVEEDGIVLASPCPVDRIPGFADGLASVQDASAQRAARLLDPSPGARVLDACAAPGGKAAHLLERYDVDLVALDSDAGRLERVRANFARLGLAGRVLCGDAATPDAWWDGTPYDCILADVPCSASGVVRRHPDIKWLRRADDIPRYAERQAAILDALWQLLRRDGKLLYATCSVFQAENSLQVARFLERHSDARRVLSPGADNPIQEPAGQILPDEDHDGFFYALLQKA